MVLGWNGERKRAVYFGEGLGIFYLVEPRLGPIRGYWRKPTGEEEELGTWSTLEEAYDALEERFARWVKEEGWREDEDPYSPPF